MKPECTTVIELLEGAPPPRLAGPTLLDWCWAEPPFSTVLPPGPKTRYSRGLLFSWPVAAVDCLKLREPFWLEPKLLLIFCEDELTPLELADPECNFMLVFSFLCAI